MYRGALKAPRKEDKMTDREIVDKAKAFMDEEVIKVRKMRDWEFFKNIEDFREFKKNAQAWLCCTCMFTQEIVKGYSDELVSYADKCRDEINNL